MRSVSDINVGIGARGLDLYLHAVPVLENDDVVGIVRSYGVTSGLEVQANRAPRREFLLGCRTGTLSVNYNRKPQDETNGETLHTHPFPEVLYEDGEAKFQKNRAKQKSGT